MTFKAAVASGLVLAGAEHVKLTYKDCGSSSTHAKVTSLKPDAIDVPGKAAIIGSGTLDSDQTGAHFNLKVTKGILPFFSGKGNICEDTSFELPLGVASFTVKGLDCPVSAGNIDVEVDLDILSDLLEDGENSLLSIHIDANADDTGDQVLCLDVDASLATELPEPTFLAWGLTEPTLNATDRQACLAAVQKYRPDMQLCAAKYNDQADTEAKYDAAHGAHAYVEGKGWEGTCKTYGTGQCECPHWNTANWDKCVKAYYDEGPGGGHYDIMMDSKAACVACGLDASSGTMTHNFCKSDSINAADASAVV